MDDLVTDTLEALGWREGFADLRKRNAIPVDFLTWNYPALHGYLHGTYSFIELDGITHAFHR